MLKLTLPVTVPSNKQIQIEGPLLGDFVAPKLDCRDQFLSLALDRFGMTTPEGSYAIQASDNKMAGAGIMRGDIAILAPVSPRRGDIVAARIEGVLRLRRYVIIQNIPHLLTENPDAPELMAAYNIPMPGVLWALVRLGTACHRIAQKHWPKVSYSVQGGLKPRPEFPLFSPMLPRKGGPIRGQASRIDSAPNLPKFGVNERLSDPTPVNGYKALREKKALPKKTRRNRLSRSD